MVEFGSNMQKMTMVRLYFFMLHGIIILKLSQNSHKIDFNIEKKKKKKVKHGKTSLYCAAEKNHFAEISKLVKSGE